MQNKITQQNIVKINKIHVEFYGFSTLRGTPAHYEEYATKVGKVGITYRRGFLSFGLDGDCVGLDIQVLGTACATSHDVPLSGQELRIGVNGGGRGGGKGACLSNWPKEEGIESRA